MSQDSSSSPAPASFSDYEPLTLQTGTQVPDIKKGEPLVLECWMKEVEDGMHFSQASIFRKDRVFSSRFLPVIGHCLKGEAPTNTGEASTGCKKSEEIDELKQKLYSCEYYEQKMDQILHQNQQMHNSLMENFTRVGKMFSKSLDTQESVIQMIIETQQLVMTSILPEQQPMQQQQPLQPAAAAALKPQPQLGPGQHIEEDESEKNASEDHISQSPNVD